MCGIIGYVGSRASKPLLIQGFERLEYRGYDSAGIACSRRTASSLSAVGDNARLPQGGRGPDVSVSTTGIGHTRWATHGRVTERTRTR